MCKLLFFVAIASAWGARATNLRGVGLNTFDLMFHYVGQSPNGPDFARTTMRDACTDRNITLLRVAATGFWPDDLKAWRSDPDAWFAAMATMLADAEQAGCRLILNLFWNAFGIPDLAGEPLHQALTDPTSRSRSWHAEYIARAAAVAGNSTAVAAWELTNELNLIQDLDLSKHQPGLAPSRGTPPRRTRADNVSARDVAGWGVAMTSLLAQHDPLGRPVSSGHAVMRPSAWHLSRSFASGSENWTPDDEAQFVEAFQAAQAPFRLASAHLYGGPGRGNVRFNSTPVGPFWTGLVPVMRRAAGAMEPPAQLLLGEFGDPLPGARPWTQAMLDELTPGGGADLGLVWCFRFHQVSATLPANFSLEPGRDDRTLDAVQAANGRFQ